MVLVYGRVRLFQIRDKLERGYSREREREVWGWDIVSRLISFFSFFNYKIIKFDI